MQSKAKEGCEVSIPQRWLPKVLRNTKCSFNGCAVLQWYATERVWVSNTVVCGEGVQIYISWPFGLGAGNPK